MTPRPAGRESGQLVDKLLITSCSKVSIPLLDPRFLILGSGAVDQDKTAVLLSEARVDHLALKLGEVLAVVGIVGVLFASSFALASAIACSAITAAMTGLPAGRSWFPATTALLVSST
jgi:hypothetical protein